MTPASHRVDVCAQGLNPRPDPSPVHLELRLAFAAEVEQAALEALRRHKPGRSLQSNIEMNAALLLDAVGVPRDAFTQVFAIARCAGWIANALEQRNNGRMIRPDSNYVGPEPDASPA